MNHVPAKARGIACGLTLWLAAACASNAQDDWVVLVPDASNTESAMHIEGTIRHMDLEGGLYVIRAADGTNYNPTNLPQAFRVDGMPVEADARASEGMASIGMVGPLVDLVRIRERAAGAAGAAEEPGSAPQELAGSRWRLEDLAGTGVVDAVQATLEFPESGKVVGNGSCNRFFGDVEVDGESLSFGTLGRTRKACAEAVNDQETRYMQALEGARRYRIEEPFLYIRSEDLPEPLRFIRADD